MELTDTAQQLLEIIAAGQASAQGNRVPIGEILSGAESAGLAAAKSGEDLATLTQHDVVRGYDQKGKLLVSSRIFVLSKEGRPLPRTH
jgi:hypothetical protein